MFTTTTMARLLLLVTVVLLQWPVWRWLLRRLSEPDGSVSAVLMIAAATWSLSTSPTSCAPSTRSQIAAFVVVSAVSIGAVLAQVHVAQAFAVAMAFTLTMLVLRGARFHDGVLALVLFALALPARGDLDTFVGFPLRLLAADGASLLVSPWLGDVGRETVLVLEGRVADVEVACSGLSTLWTAIAASLVLGRLALRRQQWRWPTTTTLLAVSTTTVVLVAMTTVRVAILAAIALAPTSLLPSTQHLLGAVVHVPLGVLGLIAAMAAAVLVQQLMPTTTASSVRATTTTTTATTTATALLVGWLVVGGIGAALKTKTAATATATATATAATSLRTAVLRAVPGDDEPLTVAEAALYQRHAIAAVKVRTARPVGGSLLAVRATVTTAHHAPERCLASAGHRIGAAFDIDDEHGGARIVVLDAGRALSVSFFVSDALPAGTTIAGLGERVALSWRARLRGDAVPVVTFISAVWPRDSDNAELTADERRAVDDLRAALTSSLEEKPASGFVFEAKLLRQQNTTLQEP